MQNQYNLYNFEAQFATYLLAENVAHSSVKHYQSDIRHFLGWATSNHISFSQETVERYIEYLTANSIPSKTINRRLSSLRKFGSFCINQGWMKENPAKHVRNTNSTDSKQITQMSQVEKEYLDYLDKEKMSPDEKKIAVEDIREFLASL